MLAAIAQAKHAVQDNAMDIVKKHPSEWDFDWDVKFDWDNHNDEDEEQERPHHHKKHNKKDKKDGKTEPKRWQRWMKNQYADDESEEEDVELWHKIFGHPMEDQNQEDDEEFDHRGKFWWVRHDEVDEDTTDPDYCPPHRDCEKEEEFNRNHWQADHRPFGKIKAHFVHKFQKTKFYQNWEPALLEAREMVLNYAHHAIEKKLYDWIKIPTHLHQQHLDWCETMPKFEEWTEFYEYRKESKMNKIQTKLCTKKAKKYLGYGALAATMKGFWYHHKYMNLLRLLNSDIDIAHQLFDDVLAVEMLQF